LVVVAGTANGETMDGVVRGNGRFRGLGQGFS
jgi:hypothetical protein